MELLISAKLPAGGAFKKNLVTFCPSVLLKHPHIRTHMHVHTPPHSHARTHAPSHTFPRTHARTPPHTHSHARTRAHTLTSSKSTPCWELAACDWLQQKLADASRTSDRHSTTLPNDSCKQPVCSRSTLWDFTQMCSIIASLVLVIMCSCSPIRLSNRNRKSLF